jgi:hypothetical protein
MSCYVKSLAGWNDGTSFYEFAPDELTGQIEDINTLGLVHGDADGAQTAEGLDAGNGLELVLNSLYGVLYFAWFNDVEGGVIEGELLNGVAAGSALRADDAQADGCLLGEDKFT